MRYLRRSATSAVLIGLLAGCGSDGDEPRKSGSSTTHRTADTTSATVATTTRAPSGSRFCRDLGEAVQVGTVADPAITETSGIVVGRLDPDVLWVHNDSGDSARFFAVSFEGARLGEFVIADASATDWEDMSFDDATGELVFADIGDNAARRASVSVLRVPEPDLPSDPATPVTLVGLRAHEYVYPDRAHDAEAVFVDPTSGDLAILTKEFVATPQVFRAPNPEGSGPTDLIAAGEVRIGPGQLITGADVAPDGGAVVVRTYGDVFVYPRTDGQTLESVFAAEPCAAPSPTEQQGEAIAALADGSGFVTIGEGQNPLIWKVSE